MTHHPEEERTHYVPTRDADRTRLIVPPPLELAEARAPMSQSCSPDRFSQPVMAWRLTLAAGLGGHSQSIAAQTSRPHSLTHSSAPHTRRYGNRERGDGALFHRHVLLCRSIGVRSVRARRAAVRASPLFACVTDVCERVMCPGGGGLELLAHEATAAVAASSAPLPVAAAPAEQEPPSDDSCLDASGRYEGDLEDGRPHGQGKLTSGDELVYDGEWQSGRPHGYGRAVLADAGYEGNFERGFFSGHGVLTLNPSARDAAKPGWKRVLAFGSRFEGVWNNGTLVFKPGHCISIHDDGEVKIYVGDVLNGVRDGQGEEFGPSTFDDAYKGEWKDNQQHGKGELKSYQGTYVGEFQRGKKHGRGEIKSDKGELVEAGEYRNDQLHGQGVRISKEYKYDGEFVAGRPHGQGTCTTDDGQVFSGRWMDGVLHVSDTQLRWFYGDSYEGALKDGCPHGYGIKRGRDGTIEYKGEWCEGKRHGQGEEPGKYVGQYKDDQRHGRGQEGSYTGDFRDGRFHGHGRLVTDILHQGGKVGEYVYEGEWRSGLAQGEGVLTGPDGFRVAGRWDGGRLRLSERTVVESHGARFDGEWKDEELHGYGSKQAFGDYREGVWQNGKLSGQGWSFDSDYGSLYVGSFEDGAFHHGRLTWKDGSWYEGSWSANLRAHGEEKRSDGAHYIGDWDGWERAGQGEETTSSGEHYVGGWKNGKRHGAGRCAYANGYVYEGRWINGLPHGQGTSTAPDGSTTSGVWKNGAMDDASDGAVWANGNAFELNVKQGAIKIHIRNGPYSGSSVDVLDTAEGICMTYCRPDGFTYVGQVGEESLKAFCQELKARWSGADYAQYDVQLAILHGHGTLTTADKHTYTGQFVKGKCHGQGELKTPAGKKHRGTWKADWLRVKPGEFISRDGALYSGEEKDGLPHGAGEVRHVDGSISRGGFEAGVQEGVGLHLQASGELFEGDFKAGKGVRGIAWPAPADTEGSSSSSAAGRRCGRWYESKLVLPGAVPRRLLLEASRLTEHECTAALLFPDETYYIGPLNRWDLAHGEGLLFGADGAALQSGTWVHGKFQVPPPLASASAVAVAAAVDAAAATGVGPAPPGGSPAASPNVEGAVMPLVDAAGLQREVARLRAALAEKEKAHAEEIAALTRRLDANAAAL